MSLATYTLKMAAIAAPVAALSVFGGQPMPAGWPEGIVNTGATIGKAATVVGMWLAGAASTAGGLAGFVWLTHALWLERCHLAGKPASGG